MYATDGKTILSPTDLTGFMECPHKMQLDLAYMRGEIDSKPARSPESELLAVKGDEHENAYLGSLIAEGRQVVRIAEPDDRSLEALAARATETAEAMRAGAGVIFQATFFDPPFRGHADFLFRVDDRTSDLGAWSYEVADTKLARRTKPYFVLQLCFYSELLSRIQGTQPEHIHVVLGDRSTESLRLAEFSSYFRRVRDRFLTAVDLANETYPEPVAHCAVCRWLERCDAQRVADDHLSLVANITSGHRAKLMEAGVETLAELGSLPGDAEVPGIRAEMLVRLRHQASLQLRGRNSDGPLFDLLPREPGRGLARLPKPSPGDVFFDMEGDPFFEDGLEYLFGLVTQDGGKPEFTAIWGRDRAEERAALEQLVDLMVDRRSRWPELHIYHYAHYEVTALKRLAGAHGTREEELDQLLRDEVFVDLYKVVKESMRISQPSYGLKKVEAFYMDQRETSVTDGNSSVIEFERWLETGDQGILDEIAAYNRDDCESTLLLRDWLLEQRTRAIEDGAEIDWFTKHAAQPETEDRDDDHPSSVLRRELLAEIPGDAESWGEAERVRWLTAQLLDYHRREARPVWWSFFDRIDTDRQELLDDFDCIGGLRPVSGSEPEPIKQSERRWMEFPAQETKMRAGSGVDPDHPRPAVTIEEIDRATGGLLLRRGPSHSANPWPGALIPGGPYRTPEQQAALRRLAAASPITGPKALGHTVQPAKSCSAVNRVSAEERPANRFTRPPPGSRSSRRSFVALTTVTCSSRVRRDRERPTPEPASSSISSTAASTWGSPPLRTKRSTTCSMRSTMSLLRRAWTSAARRRRATGGLTANTPRQAGGSTSAPITPR